MFPATTSDATVTKTLKSVTHYLVNVTADPKVMKYAAIDVKTNTKDIFLMEHHAIKDVDVTFQVNCDSPNGTALLEVIRTSYYADGRERSTGTLMFDRVCDPKGIKSAFVVSEDAHPNPDYNTTFFVRIYNFTTPAQIVISFAQILPNTFRLTIFLFSVSSVMILLIACVFIYVKLSMRNNEEQRRMIEELERMAARPFASTKMELTVLNSPSTTVDPVPLTIEPCQDYRTGVFTLAVRLPTGGKAVTPSGTSGLAVASSLCFLSLEQFGEFQVTETGEQKNTENLPKKTKQRRPSSI
ncbi:hypothetical protein CAEBREN_16305 [Caenorhabditis brenneri]|uniref:Attractin GBD domain-containing protein n=1 Tax=Caenorhabditis brenneri TaxID=135651 RepID=G0MB75_CAEBE|nr:hypothetical protein CAEBREN_16305 [Caenorhabditis brenneri]